MDLIGNIVRVLVAFGTAMAPIASVILKVVTALAGFIAKLFETHPAIARMVGIGMILGGMLWALLAPIIAVSTLLSNVFGVGLIQAIGKMLAFARNTQILRSALNLVKIAFRLLMSPISTIMRILPMLSGAFQALCSYRRDFMACIGYHRRYRCFNRYYCLVMENEREFQKNLC